MNAARSGSTSRSVPSRIPSRMTSAIMATFCFTSRSCSSSRSGAKMISSSRRKTEFPSLTLVADRPFAEQPSDPGTEALGLPRHAVHDLHDVERLDLVLEVLRLDAVGEHRHAERARDRDHLGVRLERLIGAQQVHAL